MARRILGIDLGATNVKCVLLESAYRSFSVVEAATQPVSDATEELPLLRDRQLAALRELLAARHLAFESAVVSLPGAATASHLLRMPFSDARRIEQTIGFEVEGQIPFDLAEVAWDWQLLGTRAGAGSDVLVAVARREELAALLSGLAATGVDPIAVLPPGPAYASLFGHGALEGGDPGPGEVDLLVDVGRSRTVACFASSVGLEWARGFAIGAPDATRAPAGLLRELRATAKSFQSRFPGEPRPLRRVLLAGEGAREPGLSALLAEELGAPAGPLALTGPAAQQIGVDDQPHAALALALALRGHMGGHAPRMNLRRGDLSFTRDFQHVRGKVLRLAAFTGAVAALALVSTTVKAFALSRQEQLLDRAICDATQQIVGKCYDDYSVAESVLRGRGTPAAAIPKASAVDVFGELAQRVPADVPLRLDRIEINRDKLHLQGTTDAAENVDRVVAALRGSRCFGDARSGGARRRGGADQKFEFTIDSDLTCDTGVVAGGRAP